MNISKNLEVEENVETKKEDVTLVCESSRDSDSIEDSKEEDSYDTVSDYTLSVSENKKCKKYEKCYKKKL